MMKQNVHEYASTKNKTIRKKVKMDLFEWRTKFYGHVDTKFYGCVDVTHLNDNIFL